MELVLGTRVRGTTSLSQFPLHRKREGIWQNSLHIDEKYHHTSTVRHGVEILRLGLKQGTPSVETLVEIDCFMVHVLVQGESRHRSRHGSRLRLWRESQVGRSLGDRKSQRVIGDRVVHRRQEASEIHRGQWARVVHRRQRVSLMDTDCGRKLGDSSWFCLKPRHIQYSRDLSHRLSLDFD